jgi:hypothetical protein
LQTETEDRRALPYTLSIRPEGGPSRSEDGTADLLVLVGMDLAEHGGDRNVTVVLPDGTLTHSPPLRAVLAALVALLVPVMERHPGFVEPYIALWRQTGRLLCGGPTIQSGAGVGLLEPLLRHAGCPPTCRTIAVGDDVDAVVAHAAGHLAVVGNGVPAQC